MLWLIIVGSFAYIFYHLGEMEYRRGALLCVMSITISLAAPFVIPMRIGFLSIVIGNVSLFLALWIYNFFRKKPMD